MVKVSITIACTSYGVPYSARRNAGFDRSKQISQLKTKSVKYILTSMATRQYTNQVEDSVVHLHKEHCGSNGQPVLVIQNGLLSKFVILSLHYPKILFVFTFTPPPQKKRKKIKIKNNNNKILFSLLWIF